MELKKAFLLVIFACFLFSKAVAVDILNIKAITDRDGLPQNTVRCMMQDSRGFMWFGSINGLGCYNGKNFTVVYPHVEGSRTMPDSRIREVIEDKNGFLWIRTFSNTLFCYDLKRKRIVDYDPTDTDKNYAQVKLASNGDVWLWGRQGCCRISLNADTWDVWKPDDKALAGKRILFVHEEDANKVWLGTEDGLFYTDGKQVVQVKQGMPFWDAVTIGRQLFFVGGNGIYAYDCRTKAFSFYQSDIKFNYAHSVSLGNGIVWISTNTYPLMFDTKNKAWLDVCKFFQGSKMEHADFTVDNKGCVWVFNRTGVLWRCYSGHAFVPFKLIPQEILSLITQERFMVYHDSRDIIWITTFGNGLFALDSKTGKLEHYTADKDLPTNYLFCVTEDRSGEIWIGTELGGVIKMSLSDSPFKVYKLNSDKGMERDNAVRLIFEGQEGNYWLGTRDGNLYVCDKGMKKIYRHKIEGGLPFSIAEDTSGQKWLGTKGAGLFILTKEGDRIISKHTLYDHSGQFSSSNNVFTVLRDKKGRMWLATFGGGLHLAEQHSGKLIFRRFFSGKEQLNMMRVMILDKHGNIWAGTNNGILFFNPDELIKDSTKFTLLHVCSQGKPLMNHDEVKVIFEDSNGRIWIGVTGSGLHLLQYGEKRGSFVFQHFGKEYGLQNETIQAILEDKEKNLWLSTESGIFKFDKKNKKFENFIISNNRYPAVFNELSCWKKDNGDLMFGSYNGVYTFNPDSVRFDTYAPQVQITEFQINGSAQTPEKEDDLLAEDIDGGKVVLKSSMNSFNLEYAMLNYHLFELNQYAYYLDGYEKTWNRSIGNNMVTYRNIPPGEYVFKVKGCNGNGVWNTEVTSLKIKILPPWWATWWAITLYVLSSIIVLVFGMKVAGKIHRLNMAVTVEKQLTEYKLRFFTNISHEFRTPLTIIRATIEELANQKEIAASISPQLNLLTKSSTRLMRLINQLLEFRRLQNNKAALHLERVDVKKFYYDIYLTFQEIAKKKHIGYTFHTNFQNVSMLMDKDKADKMAYNLLSNAFKYTPDGGKISMVLEVSESDDRFVLRVLDNGPGIPADKRKALFVRFEQIQYHSGGIGIGLHLVSELAKVHKGNVSYAESEWGGACFTITLPLLDKNYDKKDIVETKSDNEGVLKNILLPVDEGDGLHGLVEEKPYRKYEIVIIDDDDDVRNLLIMQLGKYFTVSAASNGKEGLKLLSDKNPNLVICDIMMPEMDGIEFTQRLKSNTEFCHIPVVLLTAYSLDEYQLKGIRAGADAYITKPFSIKYLLVRVMKMIEQREKLQRKFASEPGISEPLISVTDHDKLLLDKVNALIEKNLKDIDFKLENHIVELGIGRTTFYNKMKSLVGCSPGEYVRMVRMKKAAELLLTTEYNVSEVSYLVGIIDPYYFSRCFKSTFGKSPSQYRKDAVNENKKEQLF